MREEACVELRRARLTWIVGLAAAGVMLQPQAAWAQAAGSGAEGLELPVFPAGSLPPVGSEDRRDTILGLLPTFDTPQNKYDAQTYNCGNFAADFCQEATGYGIPTSTLAFGPAISEEQVDIASDVGIDCSPHAINVIQTNQIVATGSLVYHEFCAVEPQQGSSFGCWRQDNPTPIVPDSIQGTLVDTFPEMSDCTNFFGVGYHFSFVSLK
jgi:hypothetical protein